MFDYSFLYHSLSDEGFDTFSQYLQEKVNDYFSNLNHGDVSRWQKAFAALPEIKTDKYNFNSDCVSIGGQVDVSNKQRKTLDENLKALMPWRKGPFNLFGLLIDSEWQCQIKWRRLQTYLDIKDKRVLDVGCGNGYYMWRMLGAGAKQVIGIDPMLRFIFQFEAIKKYMHGQVAADQAHILPLSMQDMPAIDAGIELGFDTVFSMGVLYHRRDPLGHIRHLKTCLKTGGELILETLIIDEHTQWGEVLEPAKDKSRDKRYAKMANVWNVPTINLLKQWVKEAGFSDIEVCDISRTNFEEQRVTEWMQFHSLEDFMDPNDKNKTIEGYPGPKRALLKCKV